MKIKRLRVEHFRQFRAPLELSDFADGLNLFTGANEAGKSTVVAAIRAAFFERHRSSSVDDFRPHGDSGVSPSIELDFELQQVSYRLRKSFLARKRCDLEGNGMHWDGSAAEDQLATLLGFQFAGKGASESKHWGIPGLLWIQQGSSQDVHDPIRHAHAHLRNALDASVGDVASSGGDELLAQVESARRELLTDSTGAATGAYKQALAALHATEESLAHCREEAARYRDRVDQFARLRTDHARDDAERPWEAFRAEERLAAQREDAVRQWRTDLEADRQRARELERHLGLLREQLHQFERQDHDLLERRNTVGRATQALADASHAQAPWAQALREARDHSERARHNLKLARRHQAHETREREAQSVSMNLAARANALSQAEREWESRLQAQAALSANALPPDTLTTLRTQRAQLHDIEVQLRSAATTLRYELSPGAHLKLGSDTLSGTGEAQLVDSTVLELPGLGRLSIVPGGEDLPALKRRQQALFDAHQASLEQAGVSTLDAAEARHLRQQEALRQRQTVDATLKVLAPQGLEHLRAEVATLSDALQRLKDTAGDTEPLPPATIGLSEAEAAEEASRNSMARIETQAHEAQVALDRARATSEAATLEAERAQAQCDAPERASRRSLAQTSLTDTLAEHATLEKRIAAKTTQIAQAQPELLAQDVLRYRRSAEQHEKSFNDRRETLLRLEAELQASGAQGLDERLAELERDRAQLNRRVDELRRRAEALDLLWVRLKAKRREVTRQLQAPLQAHLQRYLNILFPQSNLELDDNLLPGKLSRPGLRGLDTGPLQSLSFGAREQLGVISRLAYADLLKAAGRPTLLILDDALVHTDDERLGQMKRVLYDAATRHQVLIFSCHPAKWRDLGVAARELAAMT